METVEMDLLQAQIGSLATELTRLEKKMSATSVTKIELTNVAIDGSNNITADTTLKFSELIELLDKTDKIAVEGSYINGYNASHFILPLTGYSTYQDEKTGACFGGMVQILLYKVGIIITMTEDDDDAIQVSGTLVVGD